AVGSTGQLWLLLVCDGIVGAALYVSFFGYGLWRYRHDYSPFGIAGSLALLLSFWYLFAYDATGAPLGVTMLAYAVLWKNDSLGKPRGGPSGRAAPLPPPAAAMGGPPQVTVPRWAREGPPFAEAGPRRGAPRPPLLPAGPPLGPAGPRPAIAPP